MMSRLRLMLVGAVALSSFAYTSRALAEIHFLDGQTQFDNFYDATATLTVEIPSGFNLDGTPIYAGDTRTFSVAGKIRILSSDAKNSFVDPLAPSPENEIGPVAPGNHVVQQELVEVKDVIVTSPTAAAGNLKLGDGTADFIRTLASPTASLFSTGGSAEIGPGFTSANGFLNIFLEVEVTNPEISTPIGDFPIGFLHNEIPLHLTAEHTEYLPFGVPFNMANISGPVAPLNPIPLFSSPTHPFAQIFGRELEFARFVGAQITIFGTNPVPEANSVILGGFALLAFVGYAWRMNRRSRLASV